MNGQPDALAQLMYGGRMGNDNAGDGFRYRGRGYIQITGANNYSAAGDALGLDLIENPDLANETGNAARIAIWYWQTNVPEAARGSVRAATLAINNGTNGIDDPIARYDKWHATVTPEFQAELDPSVPEPVRPLEPREQVEPGQQLPQPDSRPSTQPVTVTPIPDFLRDFRQSHHPQHIRYEQTLA